jgi:hypothetical protein
MTSQELEKFLPEVVRRLVDALQPERIYFRLPCAGNPGPHSDVDMLVVVPDSDQPGGAGL